ncbi:hypothetical protein F4780DRAFT_633900 [Xylariomycetidae sp. FL0641]|nr:hypothetical protein F4780DRAFT_633900 [Xylariomycetidae sp. FL0641]
MCRHLQFVKDCTHEDTEQSGWNPLNPQDCPNAVQANGRDENGVLRRCFPPQVEIVYAWGYCTNNECRRTAHKDHGWECCACGQQTTKYTWCENLECGHRLCDSCLDPICAYCCECSQPIRRGDFCRCLHVPCEKCTYL